MTELAFGAKSQCHSRQSYPYRFYTGGTGALRVAGDFIKRCNPNAVLWVSDPTWANHIGLFEAAGITVKTYPYYDYDSKSLKFDEMLAALSQ